MENLVSEHWIGHVILLDHTRNFTNEETIAFANLACKVITVSRDTAWMIDPLGYFYEAVRGCGSDSRLEYAWQMWTEGPQGERTVMGDAVNEMKYTCLCCGEKWEDAPRFNAHMRGDFEEMEAESEVMGFVIWKCEECEAGFEWLGGLAEHYEAGCRSEVEKLKEMTKKKKIEPAKPMQVEEFSIYEDNDDSTKEDDVQGNTELTGLEDKMGDMEVQES
ncbi:hypothetical protein H072_1664 [Dactylellina haptotyla CBS 200.50]|uniref:Uncharacterized protein n=1 Tax=Dactylellina haptotyla (strain CBS 200.50) TaxID=1284197 RepID=S8ATS2_DACHA|nr:hypothetical protein H072_1664 [Dactylellina haptotyla CBS 200.50]